MEQPFISVIIPIYNVEKYLDRCMESVLNQTYKNLEVILVDDGSPDNSGKLADEWGKKDSRVTVFHKENGGLSDARNYALDKANGEYIVFVDSDDWLELDAINYLYELREKYDADFSIAENRRVTEISEAPEMDIADETLLSREEFLEWFFKIKTQINVQYAWAKLYKKELFSSVRYPVGMTDEDVPTTFAIACESKKIAYSNRVIYDYFVNENSITESKFGDRNFDLLRAWDLVIEIAEKKGCSSQIQAMAKMNRARADFGLLVNLAQSSNYKTDKIKYASEKKTLLKSLRSNFRLLMNSPIPKSRKITIIGFVVSYSFTAWVINKVYNYNQCLLK